ncbi:hypothetical protein MLD38_022995 [Melastoma candidum]|uniref:Uncharacterized protein n=1 Tax=Melastoma candidum TaxID=119954 RepID=A0ACB9QK85_9MYRT|nr:hypothetical protein MLD38_022995 [Melastoma candidum]
MDENPAEARSFLLSKLRNMNANLKEVIKRMKLDHILLSLPPKYIKSWEHLFSNIAGDTFHPLMMDLRQDGYIVLEDRVVLIPVLNETEPIHDRADELSILLRQHRKHFLVGEGEISSTILAKNNSPVGLPGMRRNQDFDLGWRRLHRESRVLSRARKRNVPALLRRQVKRRAIETPLRVEMTENEKVHPDCPNAANPYHECFEECYVKMGKAKPQRVKSFSGLVKRDRRRKNRESSHQQPKPETVTTFPSVEQDNISGIQSEKYEQDDSKTITSIPYSGEIHLEDFSFNKGQTMSSQSVPTSGHITPPLANSPDRLSVLMNGNVSSAVSTPSRYEHDEEKHVDSRDLLPNGKLNEPPQRAQHTPVRSLSSSITDNDRPYQDSDDDEVQSVISESRVTVGKYYVKESLASILRAVLKKYGDIAENCVMESVSMRSYSLECVCVVIQDLQSASFMQLSKAKIKEMLTILKDLEKSRVKVDWLRRVLNELSEVSDVIAQHQHLKTEQARCESSVEVLKKELEMNLDDLAAKEREVQEAKSLVNETKDKIRRREMETSKLGEDVATLRSQLENFQFGAVMKELL